MEEWICHLLSWGSVDINRCEDNANSCLVAAATDGLVEFLSGHCPPKGAALLTSHLLYEGILDPVQRSLRVGVGGHLLLLSLIQPQTFCVVPESIFQEAFCTQPQVCFQGAYLKTAYVGPPKQKLCLSSCVAGPIQSHSESSLQITKGLSSQLDNSRSGSVLNLFLYFAPKRCWILNMCYVVNR